MKTNAEDRIDLHVNSWPGNGKSVICVHGLTANCRCWDNIASSLSPDFNVIAPDLRGRGNSDKPDSGYSVKNHVRDIHHTMHRRNIQRTMLMGHSLGALIALAFAAHYPDSVEKLILIDGGGPVSKPHMTKILEGIRPSLDRLNRVFPDPETYIKKMKKAPFLRPWSQAYETYFLYELEPVQDGFRTKTRRDTIEEEIENMKQEDPLTYYPQIRCPVLVLRAVKGLSSKNDLVLPENAVRKMEQHIAGIQVFDMEDTNHYSIIFGANQTRDQYIRNFLMLSSSVG